MPHTRTTENSRENFLKAVYVLQQENERVSTNALAEALDIKAPSVTDMARRLENDGYLDYQKYKGVALTEKGENIALRVLRRHRLIELYLVEELGYELHEVHDEAEVLEHHVSDRFIEAISHKLDHPELDPHGDPIPNAAGEIQHRDLLPLSEVALELDATVARFRSEQNDMLQHIIDRGLTLHTLVRVVSRDPFEGPVTVELPDGNTCIVGYQVAAAILVEVVEA